MAVSPVSYLKHINEPHWFMVIVLNMGPTKHTHARTHARTHTHTSQLPQRLVKNTLHSYLRKLGPIFRKNETFFFSCWKIYIAAAATDWLLTWVFSRNNMPMPASSPKCKWLESVETVWILVFISSVHIVKMHSPCQAVEQIENRAQMKTRFSGRPSPVKLYIQECMPAWKVKYKCGHCSAAALAALSLCDRFMELLYEPLGNHSGAALEMKQWEGERERFMLFISLSIIDSPHCLHMPVAS